jgi:hypothetical protein
MLLPLPPPPPPRLDENLIPAAPLAVLSRAEDALEGGGVGGSKVTLSGSPRAYQKVSPSTLDLAQNLLSSSSPPEGFDAVLSDRIAPDCSGTIRRRSTDAGSSRRRGGDRRIWNALEFCSLPPSSLRRSKFQIAKSPRLTGVPYRYGCTWVNKYY